MSWSNGCPPRSGLAWYQTPAYTRALLELPGSARSKGASDAELDKIVAARAKRQELLSEPGRRWQFVIGETAGIH
ncbi:MAG: Scr1 family TA system antitoxin-like transcriptional regulator [Pseudonocardiaceae bacterium]